MGSVFKRGDRCYISYKDATGAWRQASAETTDEEEAHRFLRQVEAEVEVLLGTDATGPLTLSRYATKWVEIRRQIFETDGKQFRSWKDDRGWLSNHVLPAIGGMVLADIRPRHLKAFFLNLRRTKKLAPHSIRNIYGVLSALFRDASVDGIVTATPCILTDAELGEDSCVDPIAQAEDKYERSELQQMLSSPDLTRDERVFVAIGGLAGLRLGGIAGLCWRDYQSADPLWRLVNRFAYDGKPTKTDRPSVVPVHPTLKLILDEWRAVGWAAVFGREPTDEDPIVPRAPRKGARAEGVGTAHTEKTGGDLMDRVLEKIGVSKPAKKTHALRSTHITLCEEDGANVFYVQKWTHPGKRKKDAFDVYRRGNWEAMCREMVKLQVVWKPFGGDQKPEPSCMDNCGGGGSRSRGEWQSVPAGDTDIGNLRIAASGPSGTECHESPKAFGGRAAIGFVQPVEPSASAGCDAVADELTAALEARRRGESPRVVRRLLMRALAALDE